MSQKTYDYPSLKARFQAQWRIILGAFVFIFIADSIGQFSFSIGAGSLILFPIFYAIILGIITGPQVFKVFKPKDVDAAKKLVIVCICPFIAKIGINAGASLDTVIAAGPALLFQELGNLFTIFLALPIAIALGMKREAIGATHSINRETNLALMNDMFGPDSDEARGSLSVYIVGGMIGTIYFGFMVSLVAATGLLHPYALGMASGVGAGIMMASAVATLSEIFPTYADQISALAATSETLSGTTGIYVAIFLGIPLCNKIYAVLEPKIGRKKGE